MRVCRFMLYPAKIQARSMMTYVTLGSVYIQWRSSWSSSLLHSLLSLRRTKSWKSSFYKCVYRFSTHSSICINFMGGARFESRREHQLSWPRSPLGFIQSVEANARIVPRLCHDHFPPCPFQFTCRPPIRHLIYILKCLLNNPQNKLHGVFVIWWQLLYHYHHHRHQ
jgi:hypothetical protein